MTRGDDEPGGPTEGQITEHYRRYRRGTPILISQETQMSPGNDDQDHGRRLDKLEQQMASMIASRTTFQRLLWLVIPALLGGIVTALIYAADKISAGAERVGKTEATIEALKERLDSQAAEISQLRAKLLQLGGVDRHQPSSGPEAPHAVGGSTDRFSSVAPAGGDSGLTALHVPKLQNGQRRMMLWHSRFELQTSPQASRGWISRATCEPSGRVTSSTTGPRLWPVTSSSSISRLASAGAAASGGAGEVDEVQAARAARATAMIMRMTAVVPVS